MAVNEMKQRMEREGIGGEEEDEGEEGEKEMVALILLFPSHIT